MHCDQGIYMQLYCYKMTHDTGFAPNPFGRTLTLVTCKPMIRKCKKKGQWIAGFTSKTLTNDKVGEERLIYLMKIGDKIHMRDYFFDSLFKDKIPDMNAPGPVSKAGDNIYRPLVQGACEYTHFEQIRNPNHWGIDEPSQFDLKRDISGQFALIADEFYYFGSRALAIPTGFRPCVPKGQSAHGRLSPPDQAERFIKFIRQHYKPGRHGSPTSWPESDFEYKSTCGSKRCV